MLDLYQDGDLEKAEFEPRHRRARQRLSELEAEASSLAEKRSQAEGQGAILSGFKQYAESTSPRRGTTTSTRTGGTNFGSIAGPARSLCDPSRCEPSSQTERWFLSVCYPKARIGCACAGGRPRPKAGGPRMLPGPAPPAPGQRDSLKSVGQGTRIAQRLSWFLGLQVPLPEVCQR